MTRFRPCIDLHAGQVKQIVGGTLTDNPESDSLKTNYVSKNPASYYAQLYKQAKLEGAHVIMLGPGNDEAAGEALRTWPGHLQVGGGINDENAKAWIEAGASKNPEFLPHPPESLQIKCRILFLMVLKKSAEGKVIITSFLFPNGRFSLARLQSVLEALGGDKDKLVVDLSCRRKNETWFVAMNKWQTITEMEITREIITMLEPYCSEFLVHAADNEGLQQGIDLELVTRLSEWCSIPVTYAGGARSVDDLDLVKRSSKGKVDLTIGSALDVFGGSGAVFEDCVSWNKQQFV